MSKAVKIISILLVIFSLMLLLTPWFVMGSKGFDWKFTAFLGVTVPLVYLLPVLLLVQLVLIIKTGARKIYGLIFIASLLIYLTILWYVVVWI